MKMLRQMLHYEWWMTPSPIKLWPWWYDHQVLRLRPGTSLAGLRENHLTGMCVLLWLVDSSCMVTPHHVLSLSYPAYWYVARSGGASSTSCTTVWKYTVSQSDLAWGNWGRVNYLWRWSFSWRGEIHKVLCNHTKGAWLFCMPHSYIVSSTLVTYDGVLMAFLSGGRTRCFLSPSRATFSPALAHKFKNSNKSSKSGTVLELCMCHCHSNIVAWSNLSSNIDVTNEANVFYFITFRVRTCCLATSWTRCSSLLLPSFKEGASRMARVWARCITHGWS